MDTLYCNSSLWLAILMLLAESLAVIGLCFKISKSQPSFVLKVFSLKVFSISNSGPWFILGNPVQEGPKLNKYPPNMQSASREPIHSIQMF